MAQNGTAIRHTLHSELFCKDPHSILTSFFDRELRVVLKTAFFFFHFSPYYPTTNALFIRVLMVQESHSVQEIFERFLQPNEYPERIF